MDVTLDSFVLVAKEVRTLVVLATLLISLFHDSPRFRIWAVVCMKGRSYERSFLPPNFAKLICASCISTKLKSSSNHVNYNFGSVSRIDDACCHTHHIQMCRRAFCIIVCVCLLVCLFVELTRMRTSIKSHTKTAYDVSKSSRWLALVMLFEQGFQIDPVLQIVRFDNVLASAFTMKTA